MADWTLDRASVIITGTDTNVGKTLCAAQYLMQTRGTYWKPIQSGRPRDRETVQQITGLDDSHFIRESYDLTQPLSPHRAAQIDCVKISRDPLHLPLVIKHPPLIVEGAGGVLVPINESELMIDLFRLWALPVILVARSELGTINHTLLTIEALRNRNIELLGVVVVGERKKDNERSIATYGKVAIIDRMEIPERT